MLSSLGLCFTWKGGIKAEVGKQAQALHRNERMADVLILRGTRVGRDAGLLPWYRNPPCLGQRIETSFFTSHLPPDTGDN